MSYKLKNPSVNISPKLKFLIKKIGKEFTKKCNKTITITSGTRTPKSQALAMFNNFQKEKGTSIQRKKYKNKILFDAIADVYRKEKNNSKNICIAKMTKIIRLQVVKRKFISQHLRESAFDIRTYDLTQKEIGILLEMIKQYKYLFFQDKSKNKNPHIHIQLKNGYAIV